MNHYKNAKRAMYDAPAEQREKIREWEDQIPYSREPIYEATVPRCAWCLHQRQPSAMSKYYGDRVICQSCKKIGHPRKVLFGRGQIGRWRKMLRPKVTLTMLAERMGCAPSNMFKMEMQDRVNWRTAERLMIVLKQLWKEGYKGFNKMMEAWRPFGDFMRGKTRTPFLYHDDSVITPDRDRDESFIEDPPYYLNVMDEEIPIIVKPTSLRHGKHKSRRIDMPDEPEDARPLADDYDISWAPQNPE
jgi:hypothetical protein